MSDSSAVYQQAISFDWEALLPVIFFILYGLAQFLGSKKQQGEEEAGEEAPDVDPAERARQIREEIRKKIEARKEQQEADRGAPVREADHRPSYDPNVPELQQPRPVIKEIQQPERPQPVPQTVTTAEAAPRMPIPDFEARLKEQQQRLEESRKQQQAAHAQARRVKQQARSARRRESQQRAAPAPSSAPAVGPDQLRRELLAGLRDPLSLRKAVLYREILDPPVGLR